MDSFLSIAKILNFHGMKGEVKVGYTPGNEDRLKSLKKMYIQKDGLSRTLTIQTMRFHKKSALIKFKEITSIDEAIEVKGAVLKVEKSKIQEFLEEDEYYIDDLVGLEVYDQENNPVGIVDFIANQGGGNILSIKDSDNEKHMVPFVKDLVPEVNIKAKKIKINAIPGLINKKVQQ